MRSISQNASIALAFLWLVSPHLGQVRAADRWWDTGNGSGLQAGDGNWSTSAGNWNSSATPSGGGRGNWTNGDNAIFQTNGTSAVTVSGTVQVATIAFNGTGYTVGGTELTLTGTNITTTASGTIDAPIGGSVGLTKLGLATLTLGGTNTYTGLTTVSAGAIVLSTGTNSIASSSGITVAAGALFQVGSAGAGSLNLGATQTLSGNGTVRGGVNAPSGAKITPGSSVGKLTLNGAGGITMASGATLEVELGAPTTAGTTYDQLVIDGGGSSKTFTPGNATLKLVGLSGITTGQAYTIVSAVNSGTINTGSFFKNADLAGTVMSSNATTYSQNGLSFTLNQTSSAITVTFSAVPEPSTLGLAMLAAPVILRRRRRA